MLLQSINSQRFLGEYSYSVFLSPHSWYICISIPEIEDKEGPAEHSNSGKEMFYAIINI